MIRPWNVRMAGIGRERRKVVVQAGNELGELHGPIERSTITGTGVQLPVGRKGSILRLPRT